MRRKFDDPFLSSTILWGYSFRVADHAGQIRAVVSFREIGLRGLRHPSAILGKTLDLRLLSLEL